MCGFLFLFVGYLAGSIPTGMIIARLAGGADPRTQGSGNIGATNVGRLLGKGPGLLTLAGDALKGALPPLAALWLAAPSPAAPACAALAGAGAVLGHTYPMVLNFKGGKGVATAVGVFLALEPVAVLCAAAVFGVLVWRWRYVSLGSIGAALSLPAALALLGAEPAYIALGAATCALVIGRHRGNIGRLRAGREHRLGERLSAAKDS